jgi:anti-sigma regulatory factor (Ser/Thr protein kinase)
MPYYRCAACGLTSYNAAAYTTASVCPNCSAPLGEATKLHVTPGATDTTTRVFAARPEAIAEARREVVGLPLPSEARDQLALLVSELVTNAVLHANVAPGDPVRLEITMMRPGRARIEVHDCGQGFDPPSSTAPDPLAVGGQGLVIVAAISDTWGVVRDAGGCTVWCEVPVEQPPPVIEHEVAGADVRELAVEMARLADVRSA